MVKLCNILLACLFCINGWACDETKGLPINLLGKGFQNIRQQFISITTDGDFVDEFGEKEGDDSRALVIDKDRYYFTLHMTNNIITGIYIEDNCLVSSRNIRVGDDFASVRSAYPDAIIKVRQGIAASSDYDLATKDGQIEFWFNRREIVKTPSSGDSTGVGDKNLEQVRLWVIYLKH